MTGKAKQDWMDTEYALAQFGDKRTKALREYRNFLIEGGWSQVLAMKRRGQREEFDERILGGGDFVNSILKEAEERELRQLKAVRSGEDIHSIIDQVCRKAGISPTELQSGGKRRKVCSARAVIGLRSREELGLSAAEIARHLGVNTSGISRAIEREEKRCPQKLTVVKGVAMTLSVATAGDLLSRTCSHFGFLKF